MNENSKNAIDLAYEGDVANMQSAIEDAIKDKILSAFEYKKQEIAQNLINTNEEKCCDELSSKQKKEMDVDDDEDIDEKDLKALRRKKLNKEEVEELEELSKNALRKYIGKNVASTMYTNSDDIPKNRKKGLKTAYNKLNKESYIEEKLSVEDGVKAWIDDFISSDDPRFEGKSKEERRQQAIAAYYSAKKGK